MSEQNYYINVKNEPFNAKGDGDTPDHEAIQEALDTKRNVFIPAGTYKCLKSLRVYSGQIVTGEGLPDRDRDSDPRLHPSTTSLRFEGDIDGIYSLHSRAVGLRNLRIEARYIEPKDENNNIRFSKTGVKFANPVPEDQTSGIRSEFYGLHVIGFQTGFHIGDMCWETRLVKCFADNAKSIGFLVENAANTVTLQNCSVLRGLKVKNETTGFVIRGGASIEISSPRAENCFLALEMTGGSVTMSNIYFENNDKQGDIRLSGGHLNIRGGIVTHNQKDKTIPFFVKHSGISTLDIQGISLATRHSKGWFSVLEAFYEGDKGKNHDVKAWLRRIRWNAKVKDDKVFAKSEDHVAPIELSFTNIPEAVFKRFWAWDETLDQMYAEIASYSLSNVELKGKSCCQLKNADGSVTDLLKKGSWMIKYHGGADVRDDGVYIYDGDSWKSARDL